MDRGIYKYKCSDCGHEFIGIYMELNCTAASVPVRCPKCGSLKLSITYAELQDYVADHFHKTVNVGYVDGDTMSVSVPIKVLGFTKNVSINIIVKGIEGTDLFLSYDGKMGIDLLVSPAISYAKKLVPEKAGFVEQMPGNIVKLRLGDIDKLQKVFEKVALKGIRFTPESIEADIALL